MKDDTFHLEKEEEEKELAWLPVSLVNKLKRTEGKGEQEKLILDYISQSERYIEYSIESLEDDVVRYKGAMLKARKAFEDAKDEQLSANYEMWEKFEEELPKLSEKVDKVTSVLDPIKKEVEDLQNSLTKLQTYKIEDLLRTVSEISNHLASNSKTGEILKFLVREYK